MTSQEAAQRLGIATRHRQQPIDAAVIALVTKDLFRTKHDRGYSCDGTSLYLNSHLIAFWHAGAARVFHKHVEYCSYMVANATVGVRRRLKALELFADADRRVCFEHDDCRAFVELGAACSDARWAPPAKPYFDRQKEARRSVPAQRTADRE